MMQVAFLDLERERSHFIVERWPILVFVCVIDVLQELPMMGWGQNEYARLHNVVAARRQAPKCMPVRGVQRRATDVHDMRIVLVIFHQAIPERPVVLHGREHRFIDGSDLFSGHAVDDGGRVRVDHDVGIEPHDPIVCPDNGRLQNEALLPRRRTRHRSRRDVQRAFDRNNFVPVPVCVSAPPRLAEVMPSKPVGSSEQQRDDRGSHGWIT